MHHGHIDKYSSLNSFIHSLDVSVKFFTLLIFVVAVVTLPEGSPARALFFFFPLVIMILISKVPLKYILKKSLLIIPFALLIAIFLPFFKKPGDETIKFLNFTLSLRGINVFLNIILKSFISCLATILFISTTKFAQFSEFLKELHIPAIFTDLLSFTYRFIYIIPDEFMRMMQARNSRYFGQNIFFQIKNAGHLIGALFIRSYERGERTYLCMKSRGFSGSTSYKCRRPISIKDILFFIFSTGFIVVLRLIL